MPETAETEPNARKPEPVGTPDTRRRLLLSPHCQHHGVDGTQPHTAAVLSSMPRGGARYSLSVVEYAVWHGHQVCALSGVGGGSGCLWHIW